MKDCRGYPESILAIGTFKTPADRLAPWVREDLEFRQSADSQETHSAAYSRYMPKISFSSFYTRLQVSWPFPTICWRSSRSWSFYRRAPGPGPFPCTVALLGGFGWHYCGGG